MQPPPERHCRECRVLRPEICSCRDLFARSERVDAVAVPLLVSALGANWAGLTGAPTPR